MRERETERHTERWRNSERESEREREGGRERERERIKSIYTQTSFKFPTFDPLGILVDISRYSLIHLF